MQIELNSFAARSVARTSASRFFAAAAAGEPLLIVLAKPFWGLAKAFWVASLIVHPEL